MTTNNNSDINQRWAEAEKAAHELGQCFEPCQHCEVEADLEREYQARFVFDRLFGGLKR